MGVPQLERYEIGAPLGSGGSATVYVARDLLLGRQVAIKVLHERLGEEGRRRFLREAQLAAGFRHPNAIEVYEFLQTDDHAYLVMERVNVPSLATVLSDLGQVSWPSAVVIGSALADVLAAAHETGLVHRDVKPGNVFVEGSIDFPTRVRLADFGLAFMADPDRATLGRITREGVTLGTPMYMSPEQIEATAVGPPSDVYALSAMLYELLAGRPPFVGNTIPVVFASHLYLPPIPLAELELIRPVPPWLDELILDGLAKPAANRPDAATFGARLRSAGMDGRTARPRRPTSAPAGATRSIARVWTEEVDLATALIAAGVAIDRGADVELRIVDDDPQPPGATSRVIALHAQPTSRWIAAAIRSGYVGAVRWPGPLETILKALARLPVGIPGG